VGPGLDEDEEGVDGSGAGLLDSWLEHPLTRAAQVSTSATVLIPSR
jgi:hypothetical protein